MEGDISDVAICTSLHADEASHRLWEINRIIMSESPRKHSQRDDPGGEALGDSLGVHTEGAVFGAGAGCRTAGYLRGSPGIQLPRQAKTQSPQTEEPRPSLSEFQHLRAEGRNPPLKVSAQRLVQRQRSARSHPQQF